MTSDETIYHTPALLQESIGALNIKPDGTYVDVTFGGGGHSREILKHLGKKGKLIAFDRDLDAQANIPDAKNFTLVHHDFVHLKNFLRYLDAIPVDGILADLGISSHQIDIPERGFSFRFDAPLDMRMDKQNPLTAAKLVNESPEEELQRIFTWYGEIKNAKNLARSIVRTRNMKPIETTFQLARAAEDVLPHKENLKKYLAPIFQSLRIVVNNELEGLKSFLTQSLDVLKPGGRLAIITYHSLEDRPVKNFLTSGKLQGKDEKDFFGNSQSPWKLVHKKPVLPDEKEITRNPRARSAKLRVAEKL